MNFIDFLSLVFKKLKQKEKIHGFSEAVSSITTNEKITFFNLGPKNDWKKNLDKSMIKKMNEYYQKDLKFFRYEI